MSITEQAGSDVTTASSTVPLRPPITPRLRKKRQRLPHLDHCLNCGRATGSGDNFCPNCGQQNEDEAVALKPLIIDFLSEMVSWDSKILRTSSPLLFRPGFLTNEYLAGRRVRYLSPLKMYLVISAVFFLVLPFTMHSIGNSATMSVSPAIDAKPKPGPAHIDDNPFNEAEAGNSILTRLPKTVAEYDARQRAPHVHHDSFWIALLFRQVIKAQQDKQTFSQSLAQSILGNLPKMMFVLLPLFALQLKVVYSHRFYIEHLIFALHTHAFLFTLLTIARLAVKAGAGSGIAGIAFAVIMTAYLLIAQHRVYKQGWPKTVIKFLWLEFSYLFLLVLALILTAAASFLLA